MSPSSLRDASGPYADEVEASVGSFKPLINDLADRLSIRNEDLFPLCHGDFGHNNMIFDDEWRLLGVIDWESAFAAPWEIAAEFPLTLTTLPHAIDVPWNYDENGYPKDEESRQNLVDRDQYIKIVIKKEREKGLTEGYTLSSALQDSKRQDLAYAMTLYQGGKAGFFSKVMAAFSN